MARATLPGVDGEQAAERGVAIRALLARPLLDATRQLAEFRTVARNREWLTTWFENTCGWQLTVDVMGGFARLAKRSAHPDPTRPARRTRGSEQPFDPRRYELLCLLCAELSKHPLSTIGILAAGIEAATRSGANAHFDATLRRERSAFVDAFKLLEDWGVVTFSAGDLEDYVADEGANAFVKVDTARLHRLLASAVSPSALVATPRPDQVLVSEEPTYDPAPLTDPALALAAEPRYGDAPIAPDAVPPDLRTRWLRHSLARRLLDDPVLYLEDLTEAQQAYLAHPSGRRWLRERAAEAGLPLEERQEGIVALDPEGRFGDLVFPAPSGNVAQAALILTGRFLASDGTRRLVPVVSMVSLAETIRDTLRRHPGWAKAYHEADSKGGNNGHDAHGGPARLAAEAVALLEALGLVRREDDLVRPMPAVARYRATEPSAAAKPAPGQACLL